ncbi:MAG: hypothetical protein EVJ48_07105 [Candidatus Acidulodesulfobacterium acidiphilum]|uniref:Uncharacterized protein n=1 Tax=Candidatus Acidulodesulfobacterium acidiphilum TaxID=2597224 RepID=A0A520XB47_9DELT|nr:MAG: hypothetical protein EVJ48_07105 [Candidatus Acidulodesulfobacterium acidiphilum]
MKFITLYGNDIKKMFIILLQIIIVPIILFILGLVIRHKYKLKQDDRIAHFNKHKENLKSIKIVLEDVNSSFLTNINEIIRSINNNLSATFNLRYEPDVEKTKSDLATACKMTFNYEYFLNNFSILNYSYNKGNFLINTVNPNSSNLDYKPKIDKKLYADIENHFKELSDKLKDFEREAKSVIPDFIKNVCEILQLIYMEIEKTKEQNKENRDMYYLLPRHDYAISIFYDLIKLQDPNNSFGKIPENSINDYNIISYNCNNKLEEKLKEFQSNLGKLNKSEDIGEDCIDIIDGLINTGANKFKGKCKLI